MPYVSDQFRPSSWYNRTLAQEQRFEINLSGGNEQETKQSVITQCGLGVELLFHTKARDLTFRRVYLGRRAMMKKKEDIAP